MGVEMGQLGLFDQKPKPEIDPEDWRRSWPACVLCGVQDKADKVWSAKYEGSVHTACMDDPEKIKLRVKEF
jgi:hypothetical protein